MLKDKNVLIVPTTLTPGQTVNFSVISLNSLKLLAIVPAQLLCRGIRSQRMQMCMDCIDLQLISKMSTWGILLLL